MPVSFEFARSLYRRYVDVRRSNAFLLLKVVGLLFVLAALVAGMIVETIHADTLRDVVALAVWLGGVWWLARAFIAPKKREPLR